jgi:hypothetical protein
MLVGTTFAEQRLNFVMVVTGIRRQRRDTVRAATLLGHKSRSYIVQWFLGEGCTLNSKQ